MRLKEVNKLPNIAQLVGDNQDSYSGLFDSGDHPQPLHCSASLLLLSETLFKTMYAWEGCHVE